MGSVSELATWESGEAAAPGPWAGSDDVAQEHEIRLDVIICSIPLIRSL
jgi:hypothetical protein